MACDTLVQSEGGTDDGTYTVGEAAFATYRATKIVADWVSGSKTICAVSMKLAKVGSPTNNLTLSIYSHNAGVDEPDSVISTSDSMAMSGMPGAAAEFTFTGLNAALTHGTTYWLVLFADGMDAANHIAVTYDSTMTTEKLMHDTDTASWSSTSTFVGLWFWLYEAAGGGDSVLVVGDLAYAQALDGPVLSQLHNLTVNDLGYVYYSYVNDGSVLKQQHNLSAAELSYSYGIDAVVINQIHNLIVSDLVYAMGLDAVTLGQAHNLVVSDLAYAYGLDALNLAGAITLTVADLDYAQSVDGVSVVQAHVLGVSDLGYTQTLDAVLLNQQHLLSVRDLLYTYGLDSIVWSGAVGDLTITCSGGGMTISVSAKGSPRITATGIPVPKITAQ